MIDIGSLALASVYNNACTSDPVNFEPDIWRDATTTIGASVTYARATATIGTFPDPAVSNTATALGVVMDSGPKLERLGHVAASSSIKFWPTRTSKAPPTSPPPSAPSSRRRPSLPA